MAAATGQREAAVAAQWEHSTMPALTAAVAARSVLLVRGGERMDRIFPEWLRTEVNDAGVYCGHDQNQPCATLPPRVGGVRDFDNDSPLTEFGCMTATMLGRGMVMRRVRPKRVFVSPALRSLQTAAAILRVMGDSAPTLCVEPGLFEPLAWYGRLPAFIDDAAMRQLAMRVHSAYQPVVSVDKLRELHENGESFDAFFARAEHTTKQLLGLADGTSEPVGPTLVVAHAPTVDAAARCLVGRGPSLSSDDARLNHFGVHYPYCCVLALSRRNKTDWSFVHEPLPPLSCVPFSNRVNTDFLNR